MHCHLGIDGSPKSNKHDGSEYLRVEKVQRGISKVLNYNVILCLKTSLEGICKF